MQIYTVFAVVLMAGILFFLLENYRSNHALKTAYHVISSSRIPKEFHQKKCIFLSDLHNNQFGKDNERLLEQIHREQPDFILVGGDMLVSKRENAADLALPFMEKLASRYPVYCANGNHEARLLWKKEECPEAEFIYQDYIEKIKAAGVIHLCNDTASIGMGTGKLYVSGLEPEPIYYQKMKRVIMTGADIREKLGEKRRDSFHILLAHNPAYFDAYREWGADLTLSGHVHGGIMRLPFLGGVIAPSYHLFPKYDAGEFTIGDQKMIVSVGLGSHSIKIRLFNPPKIDVITFMRKEEGVLTHE